MNDSTISGSSTRPELHFGVQTPVPVMLVAYCRDGSTTVDRCLLCPPFVIGRGSGCDLTLRDDKASKEHLRITQEQGAFLLHDLGSTNGTFVNGSRVSARTRLSGTAVIRIGRTVLVFHDDGQPLLDPPPVERFGMEGRFHVGALLAALREAAASSRHVLLTGGSGSGKELAARALAAMMGRPHAPLKLVVHNAARFASEEEAASTLFGVADRVFSNVASRAGLIEQAHKGALFLDEAHVLPDRVQRSLLRVIEDGQLARIGETRPHEASVRFILATNVSDPTAGLSPDLFARVRLVRVPPLTERIADIPSIFASLLGASLTRQGIAPDGVLPLLSGDHFETLCLDGFPKDNVRGLIDIADRIATRIYTGTQPGQAITAIFSERFKDGAVAGRHRTSASDREEGKNSSHYNKHKETIIATFKECGGNISATERLLRSSQIRCSRRWLAVFLERWGVKRDPD